LIPHFYDKVRSLSDAERASLAKVPETLEQWQEETGLKKPWGEAEYSVIERTTARPTCEVNGIWGGFQGEGSKTIIPAEAAAKVSLRLVADQVPNEVERLFTDFVKSFVPDDFVIKVRNHSNGWPVITPIDSKEMKAASKALETTWGKAPVFTREGGSIPVAATIQKELGASVVLLGFGLDDNVHAPNEHFFLAHFYKGIDTIIHYYHNLVS
jgi:acetylornithine deacetylase/succinyl-diaminopimelate desuccinylase-like protein